MLIKVRGIYFWRRPCIRPSIPSVRPHFLSVRNHISVPIGQICIILCINDKYNVLSISYKFFKIDLFHLSYGRCFSKGNYNAKPKSAFLCDDLHISSKLLYLATSHYRP